MRFAHLAALVAAVAVASVADASQTVASDAPITDRRLDETGPLDFRMQHDSFTF